QYFAETDEFVNTKIKAALLAGFTVFACVGESHAENEAGETATVVTRRTRAVLDRVQDPRRVVIAYEPAGATGPGRAATPEGANQTTAIIRNPIRELAGKAAGDGVRIQYGGSVTAENFGTFISQPDIDGALVGGASLKADSFVEIVRLAA